MSDSYRPDTHSALTLMLVVHDAAAALDFYGAVFGARVVARMAGPDGGVLHSELDLGGAGRFQVMDANPDFHMVAPDVSTDDVAYSVAIYVPDVDAAVDVARRHGATVREEASDFAISGERFASIRDPYGVRWTLLCRTTPKSDEEIQAGLDAWAASM